MFIALPLELASLSVFSMALYLEVHLVRGDYEYHLTDHLTTSHIYTTYYILFGLPDYQLVTSSYWICFLIKLIANCAGN